MLLINRTWNHHSFYLTAHSWICYGDSGFYLSWSDNIEWLSTNNNIETGCGTIYWQHWESIIIQKYWAKFTHSTTLGACYHIANMSYNIGRFSSFGKNENWSSYKTNKVIFIIIYYDNIEPLSSKKSTDIFSP